MSLRAINKRYVEPVAQWTMVFGIAALCQPWILWLHAWSVAICIAGFVAFLVSIHIPPPTPTGVDEDDTGGVSLGQIMRDPDHG
jgi:hypothetical protein